jgi:hypothetical protein
VYESSLSVFIYWPWIRCIEEYHTRSLSSMFQKCHHHLHSLVKFESDIINQKVDEDCSLNIFDKMTRTSEPTKNLVKRALLIFKRFQMNGKNIKCFFQGLENHETMFPIVAIFAYQILKIVRSQIEINRFFSFIRIHINMRKCHLKWFEFWTKIGLMTLGLIVNPILV